MRFEYISAYKLFGVNMFGKETDTEIVRFPEYGAIAIVTDNPDEYCFNADRGNAITSVTLQKLTGQLQEEDFKSALEDEIMSIRKERKERYGQGAFLVFHATGEVESPPYDADRTADFETFAICLGQNKLSIKDRFKDSVNGVLSAIALAISADYTLNSENVTECTCLLDAADKVFYYPHFFLSGTVSSASFLTADAEQFVGKYAKKLGEDRELVRVSSLLVQSLQARSDNLRSFLSAWTALEILINKTFKIYESEWWGYFTDESSPALSREFFDRAKTVLDGKYRLLDKFIVLSSLLSPHSADADLKELGILKGIRDKLTHGEEISDADLPTIGVQTLLRKYLRLYIEKRKI